MPYSFSGIFAGQLLAFGRALGETMAVAMVIGNQNIMPEGLFSAGSTIATVIANEYPEASGVHIAALTEIGLILFLITIVFGFAGRIIINRMGMRGTA
jgi:phosphate transport system permease protein